MKVDVTTMTVIDAPREAVAAYASDPSNVPEWYSNISSVEWIDEPVVTPGARVAFVAHFLGRRMAYTYTLTDVQPGKLLVMRTAEGPFPMETRYEWTDAPGGGTHMVLTNRGEPSGFSGMAAPLMVKAMKHATKKDLSRLKALMEERHG